MWLDMEPMSSYWLRSIVGGRGRFTSGESKERCWTRVFAGLRMSGLGLRSEVLDALWDGGPTKSAGAGSRFVCVLVSFLSFEDMVGDWLDSSRSRAGISND